MEGVPAQPEQIGAVHLQHAALTAEHFDRTEVKATQARVREVGVDLAGQLQAILLDSVAGLPDDVRREIPRTLPLGLRGLDALSGDEAAPAE